MNSPLSPPHIFLYNGLGLRVGKQDSTGTTHALCDGASPGSPLLCDGYAVYTPGLSEHRSSASTFYSNDKQGNLWTQNAADGAQTYYTDFTAFGAMTAGGGSTSTPFKFGGGNGCQSDADTGLVLMGHRYYDPRTGRFLSQDPAGDGDNWYAYAGNSPSNAVDPSGLFPMDGGGPSPFEQMASGGAGTLQGNLDFQGGDYTETTTTHTWQENFAFHWDAATNTGSYQDTGTEVAGSDTWSVTSSTFDMSGMGGGAFANVSYPKPPQPDSFWDYMKREILSEGHGDNHSVVEVPFGAIVPGRGIGPSGKPKIHNPKFPSKKEAFEAAKRASKGGQDPVHHANPTVGWPHYHPADEAGEIIKNGVHYNYPP